MTEAAGAPATLTPLAPKDAPTLIESVFPAQKVSFEVQRERKAGAGQTLTALGSYWNICKSLIIKLYCVGQASCLPLMLPKQTLIFSRSWWPLTRRVCPDAHWQLPPSPQPPCRS